jgi:hypothetical protein
LPLSISSSTALVFLLTQDKAQELVEMKRGRKREKERENKREEKRKDNSQSSCICWLIIVAQLSRSLGDKCNNSINC